MGENNSNKIIIILLIIIILSLSITMFAGIGYFIYQNRSSDVNVVEDTDDNDVVCEECEECQKCENSNSRIYRFFGTETGKEDNFDMYTMLVLYDNTFEFYANRLGGVIKFTGTYTEDNSSIIIKLSDNSEYSGTDEAGTETITFTKINGDKELSFSLNYTTGFDAGSHFYLEDSVYNK